jgi:glutathione S-transferase
MSGLRYVGVEQARVLPGLRLVLTRDGPGPWSEAAKYFFDAKRVAYTPVAQVAGSEDPALRAWTGQTSAPAAALDAEPPVSSMADILLLAERCRTEPALLPADAHGRAWVFGLCRELSGRDGLGWSRRLMLLDANLARQRLGPAREQSLHFARKYGYSAEAAAHAPARVAAILRLFADELRAQRTRGSRYLVGDSLSAADLMWAAFAVLFAPLPHDVCPMSDGLRRMYTATDPALLAALDPLLLEHRDLVYARHLELPLRF